METIPFPTDPALYFLIRKQVVFQFRVTRLQHVAALNEPRSETAVITQNTTRFRHDYFDLFRLLVGEVCKRRIVLFFLFRRHFDSSFFGLFRFGKRFFRVCDSPERRSALSHHFDQLAFDQRFRRLVR